MSIFDWIFGNRDERLPIELDLPFVQSDLVEIHLTDAEIAANAQYDAMAAQNAQAAQPSDVPIGKQVF